MELAGYFLKSKGHRRFIEAVFADGLEASAYEFSKLSGLGYSTTYYELERLEKLNAVVSRKDGHAVLYKSRMDRRSVEALKTVFGFSSSARSNRFTDEELKTVLLHRGAPLVLGNEAKLVESSLGEMFARSALLAKKDPAVARSLPVVLYNNRDVLNPEELVFWAKRLHAKRELGFFLALTGELSGEKRFGRMAGLLKDRRERKPRDFFRAQTSSQRQLAEQRTPALARRWNLRMNMSMESFKSTFDRFCDQ